MAHRPDGCTSTASNFLIRLRASGPWGMSVLTDELQHAISITAMGASGPWAAFVRTVEVESAISILVARASGRGYFYCDSCLTETRVLTGYHIVRTVGRSFLYRNLESIWDWSSTDRRLDVLLKRPERCKLDRTFSTQWRVRTEVHVVRTDDARYDWRSDGMACRPDGWNSCEMSVQTGWLDSLDGWQGTEIFTVQSLLRELWIVKSLFITSFHIQVILSKTQNEAKILTLCFALCPFEKKRGSNFYFWTRIVFLTGQVIFVPEWPKGEFVIL
jgi:hypothetical protein